jgi:hypothetical protein
MDVMGVGGAAFSAPSPRSPRLKQPNVHRTSFSPLSPKSSFASIHPKVLKIPHPTIRKILFINTIQYSIYPKPPVNQQNNRFSSVIINIFCIFAPPSLENLGK